MAGCIGLHPRNAFQGLLLVNVDDTMYVYQLAETAMKSGPSSVFKASTSSPSM
jgi:hypothetical protein